MHLKDIKGVGVKKIELLNKLGIYTPEDLLYYLPKRYEDRSKLIKISDAIDGLPAYFEMEVTNLPKTYFYQRNKSVTRIVAKDETASINIIWYNDRYTSKSLEMNKKYKFYGIYDREKKAIINPKVSKLDDDSIGSITPIYKNIKGFSQKDLIRFKDYLFEIAYKLEEYLDYDFIKKEHIYEINDMLFNLHKPKSFIELYNAYFSLNFRNMYIEKLSYQIYNQKLNENFIKFNYYSLDNILNNLDFKLTSSQLKSLNEIIDDMTSNKRMNRILIGDVGSGKTIIAILSSILAIKNGYQVGFMAPTEILAIQHYTKYEKLFHKLGIMPALLIGSLTQKQKDTLYNEIQSKKIDIVFGTHALFQTKVEFSNLGLVITDEQQRFGVYQRKRLYDKGIYPDMLSLSATPIPRTLALSIYNDLDLSYIEELPKNRLPIKSYLTSIYQEKHFIDFAYGQIKNGHQVYIVVSRVQEDDNLESVERLFRKLKKYFQGKINIDILHGAMDSETKEQKRMSFSKGNIDLLIATSIVEVGIDVPNANTMIIYDANQFGLSQLHQMRGRVGRSDIQSYCFFVVNKKNIDNEKLEFISTHNNGFEIAKKDLDIRGHGDLIGNSQSGFIELDNYFEYNQELINLVNKLIEKTNKLDKRTISLVEDKLKQLEKVIFN